jgi:hypothetical protein
VIWLASGPPFGQPCAPQRIGGHDIKDIASQNHTVMALCVLWAADAIAQVADYGLGVAEKGIPETATTRLGTDPDIAMVKSDASLAWKHLDSRRLRIRR